LKENINFMSRAKLAEVWAPLLIHAPNDRDDNSTIQHQLLRYILDHYSQIFTGCLSMSESALPIEQISRPRRATIIGTAASLTDLLRRDSLKTPTKTGQRRSLDALSGLATVVYRPENKRPSLRDSVVSLESIDEGFQSLSVLSPSNNKNEVTDSGVELSLKQNPAINSEEPVEDALQVKDRSDHRSSLRAQTETKLLSGSQRNSISPTGVISFPAERPTSQLSRRSTLNGKRREPQGGIPSYRRRSKEAATKPTSEELPVVTIEESSQNNGPRRSLSMPPERSKNFHFLMFQLQEAKKNEIEKEVRRSKNIKTIIGYYII
jgi:hypothetical protein